MADLLANKNWGLAVEKKTINTTEYLFVRKQNVLAQNVNPEQYIRWVQACIQNNHNQAIIQREEELETAAVQRKYQGISNDMAQQLDLYLSQEIALLTEDRQEYKEGFVLTEANSFGL